MFPFRSGEVSFQPSGSISGDQETDNYEDMNMLQNNALAGVGSVNTSHSRGRGRARGARSSSLPSTSTLNDNPDQKLATHREIERQRRQKMAHLYSSLRSILPPEYTQGKRSISDHIEEAMNYIKDLEGNVKELGAKRDELKKSGESTSSRHEAVGPGSSFSQDSVTIRPFEGGMQVEITVACDDDVFSLSAAIRVIIEQGLGVVSCTSSKISDRYFHHSLICEVTEDGPNNSIDVNDLRKRLIDLVSL